MGNGYSSSIVVRTGNEFSATYDRKNLTPHLRIHLTKHKKRGIKRSQLKNLNGRTQKLERLAKTDGLYQLLTKAYTKMIETIVPAIIALVTGTAVLFNKVNHRVTLLDNKVDKLELKVVETYTPKQEFTAAMLRMEDHLIRIEDKMDQLVNKKCN
jgi:hypothetical protein